MTQRETFAEFAERVKPTSGQKFKDNRGNKWEFDSYSNAFKTECCGVLVGDINAGSVLTHDFIEPLKPKLLAPGIYKSNGSWFVVDGLFDSSEEFKKCHTNNDVYIWPAIPNAEGFYEVEA